MFKQREEAIMRRKIMTAFVCAIMTISVIPVYADDTQTDQAVTTEVSTETAATVQETKRTQSKEQLKKKTTSKKHTKTMAGKRSIDVCRANMYSYKVEICFSSFIIFISSFITN